MKILYNNNNNNLLFKSPLITLTDLDTRFNGNNFKSSFFEVDLI